MPLPLHHRSPRGVLSSSGWEREPSLVPSFASFMLGAQGWGHHPTELSTGQCFASGRALSIASRQHPGMDGWGGGTPQNQRPLPGAEVTSQPRAGAGKAHPAAVSFGDHCSQGNVVGNESAGGEQ